MTTLLLIRHATNDYVKSGRLAGWTPGVHLNEEGQAQARALGLRLADAPLRAIYSSPLERTQETAQAIADHHPTLSVITRQDIGEVQYGDWTGLKISELTTRKMWKVIQEYPSRAYFPNGEAMREFLDELDQRLGGETRVQMAALDMDLREPILPIFRVAQMGLGYDAEESLAVLVVQELSLMAQQAAQDEDDEDEDEDEDMGYAPDAEDGDDVGVVRMWATREQLRALSLQAMDMVEQGRPNPRMNGRITYYWT